jgi:Phage tail tube protein
MTTQVTAKFGAMSDTGMAKEATFGTPLSATTYFPMTGNGMNIDPGLFSPKLMFGHRDANSFALNGQYKNAGTLAGPVWPTNAATMIPGAIGPDAQPGYGVTGAAGTGTTTLSAPSAALATTVTVTSASGFTVGQVVQIDVNSPTTPTTAECRKISTIVSTTVTLDAALNYAHASGVALIGVLSTGEQFTHSIQQAVALSSYTVEKNLGGPASLGGQSILFAGSRVNKLSINVTATDAEAALSADMVAQSAAVLDSPTNVVVINEMPYVFAEGTLSLFGQTVAQASGFTMDIDNKLISTYTFNGSHNLQFLTPGMLEVSGKIDLVWQSFDDGTWGYWSQALAGGHGVLTFTLAHPTNGGTVTFSCPNVYIKTDTEDPKPEDIVMESLNYLAFLNLATNNTISATIVNSSYLPL